MPKLHHFRHWLPTWHSEFMPDLWQFSWGHKGLRAKMRHFFYLVKCKDKSGEASLAPIVSKTFLEAKQFFPPQKIEQILPHWQNGLFPVSVSCDQQKNNLTWRFQHLPFRRATKMADVDRCCGATVFLMIFQATSTHDLPIHSGHDFPFCWCKIPTSSGKVAFESWENCIQIRWVLEGHKAVT